MNYALGNFAYQLRTNRLQYLPSLLYKTVQAQANWMVTGGGLKSSKSIPWIFNRLSLFSVVWPLTRPCKDIHLFLLQSILLCALGHCHGERWTVLPLATLWHRAASFPQLDIILPIHFSSILNSAPVSAEEQHSNRMLPPTDGELCLLSDRCTIWGQRVSFWSYLTITPFSTWPENLQSVLWQSSMETRWSSSSTVVHNNQYFVIALKLP